MYVCVCVFLCSLFIIAPSAIAISHDFVAQIIYMNYTDDRIEHSMRACDFVSVYIFECNISAYRIECIESIGDLSDFSVNIHPIH